MRIVPIITKNPFKRYAKIIDGLKQKRNGKQNTLIIPEIRGIKFALFIAGGCILKCKIHPPKDRRNNPRISVAFITLFLFISTSCFSIPPTHNFTPKKTLSNIKNRDGSHFFWRS